jgi:hypothetical protein
MATIDLKSLFTALGDAMSFSKEEEVTLLKKEEKVVLKAVDEEKRLFTAVVLRPDVVDLHGDIYSTDVVEKACHDFNQFCRQGNYEHIINTQDVVVVESWIAKNDMKLGNGEVLAGDWVMTTRVENPEAWEMCKSGEFTGFSIGSISSIEVLKAEEEALSEWALTLKNLGEDDGT